MRQLELRTWEIVLVALATLLFLASLAAYVSGFPLRNHLFGLESELTEQEIGKVTKSTGTLKRELLGQADFKVISKNDTLFVQDTVVTGTDGGATLVLNDGSSIELGPRTMVKLENEEHSSILGVTRTTRVQVVAGQVTGKRAAAAAEKRHVVIQSRDEEIEVTHEVASKIVKVSTERPIMPAPRAVETIVNEGVFKSLVNTITAPIQDAPKAQLIPAAEKTVAPVTAAMTRPSAEPIAAITPSPTPTPTPTPTPSPTATESPWTLQIVAPSNGTVFKVDKTAKTVAKSVGFTWKVTAPKSATRRPVKGAVALTIRFYRLNGKDRESKSFFEKSVTTAYGQTGTHSLTVSQPGGYEAQLINNDKVAATTRFRLDNSFQGIALNQPETLDFNKNADLKNRGRRLAKVRLSWSPFPTAKTYKLKIFDRSASAEKVQELSLSDNSYTITRQNAAQTELFYEVSTTLSHGFLVHSAREKFIFDFPPPDPTNPPSKKVLTPQDMAAWEGGVLLTWQQTGVSEGYVIEVANDPKFKKILIKRSQSDNFFLFRPLPNINRYWWRVSAYAHQLTSRPSTVFEFATVGNVSKSPVDATQNQISDQTEQ